MKPTQYRPGSRRTGRGTCKLAPCCCGVIFDRDRSVPEYAGFWSGPRVCLTFGRLRSRGIDFVAAVRTYTVASLPAYAVRLSKSSGTRRCRVRQPKAALRRTRG